MNSKEGWLLSSSLPAEVDENPVLPREQEKQNKSKKKLKLQEKKNRLIRENGNILLSRCFLSCGLKGV